MIAPRPLGNMLMGNDSSMLRVQHGTKDLHPSALHRVTGTLYMLDHSGSANVAPHHSSYGLVDGNKPVMEIRVCCACRNQFDPSLQRSHRSGFFFGRQQGMAARPARKHRAHTNGIGLQSLHEDLFARLAEFF